MLLLQINKFIVLDLLKYIKNFWLTVIQKCISKSFNNNLLIYVYCRFYKLITGIIFISENLVNKVKFFIS